MTVILIAIATTVGLCVGVVIGLFIEAYAVRAQERRDVESRKRLREMFPGAWL